MNELPPEDALAFSLHHTKGEYALLLGSGLSSAAGIPTGWKITIELIRKLKWCDGHLEEARLSSEDELVSWYKDKYKKEPEYSDLIECVALSKEERKNLLQTHIEGDAHNTRHPTQAHQKIAQLVKAKKIKLIITTNFDQLLEQALEAEGMHPNIIHNEDAIKGAEPLVHSSCTLVKVHGDYLDMRIKNTSQELAKYSPKLNKYLDRIFDDFGLIVVGWSADWDQALFDAIMRAPNRRYSFYWAAHEGKTGAKAQELIDKRKGRVIDIKSADDFFITLADKVEGLDRLQAPHPVSVSAALGLARKYCRDDQYAMEWAELLHVEVEKVRDFVTGSDFPFNANEKDGQSSPNDKLKSLVEIFIIKTEILRRAALICGRWGTDKASLQMIEVIRSLAFEDQKYGDNIETKKFGASLVFYWILIGLIEAKNWKLVKELMHVKMLDIYGNRKSLISVVVPHLWDVDFGILQNYRRDLAISFYFWGLFKKECEDVSFNEVRASHAFDLTEIYISIEFYINLFHDLNHNNNSSNIDIHNQIRTYYPIPWGKYLYDPNFDSNLKQILNDFKGLSDDDERFRMGLLGGSQQKCSEYCEEIYNYISRNRARGWH